MLLVDRGPVLRVRACGTPIGTVSAEAAERLRVPRGTALVAGAHDQAASFIGAGGRAGSVSTFALGSSDCLTVETRSGQLASPEPVSPPIRGGPRTGSPSLVPRLAAGRSTGTSR